ncbi:MAG: hypothetical protein AB8B60_01785 [Sulfitobacter sp.]
MTVGWLNTSLEIKDVEYGRIKPIAGKNGYEKTALTMKTIAELLADEGEDIDALTKRADQAETPAAPAAPARPQLQQPPHMQQSAPARPVASPKREMLPPLTSAQAAPEKPEPAAKSPSFLKRLIGR